MKDIICDAIKNKKLLQFRYDDRVRVVEPHLLGRNTAEHDVLSAYLVRGYTESDARPLWRLYLMREMKQLSVLDESFSEPRKDYNPKDQRMERIYCRLERK